MRAERAWRGDAQKTELREQGVLGGMLTPGARGRGLGSRESERLESCCSVESTRSMPDSVESTRSMPD